MGSRIPRGLHSSKPSLVYQYKQIVKEYMTQSYIHDKVKELQMKYNNGSLTPNDSELINFIDQEFIVARLNAEKNSYS